MRFVLYIMVVFISLSCARKPDVPVQSLSDAERVLRIAETEGFQIIALDQLRPVVYAPDLTRGAVLDVQSEHDFYWGHLPGALPFTLDSRTWEQSVLAEYSVPLKAAVIVICENIPCSKGIEAARRVKQYGYSDIFLYPGGRDEWKLSDPLEVSLPVVKRLQQAGGALFFDMRPSTLVKAGTIPSAQWGESGNYADIQAQMPENKEEQIMFFCGGKECERSREAARSAMADGYQNVMIYVGGYPEWEGAGYPVARNGVVSLPEQLPESVAAVPVGAVRSPFVLSVLSGKRSGVTLVDVRTEKEYAGSHLPGAVNIPLDILLADHGCRTVQDKLRGAGDVVFVDDNGVRSAEMWHILKTFCTVPMEQYFYYKPEAGE